MNCERFQIDDSAHGSVGNLSNELPIDVSGPPDIWAVAQPLTTTIRSALCVLRRVSSIASLLPPTSQASRSRQTLRITMVIRRSSFVIRPSSVVRPSSSPVVMTGCTAVTSVSSRKLRLTATFYVVAGNDANVRHLKAEGHPMQPQEERRYMVGAVRFVRQALVSSGWGWLDALPEIEKVQPHIYLVNEDGDVPEKRAFCTEHGLEYIVLKRLPLPGLKRRSSTDLRGF